MREVLVLVHLTASSPAKGGMSWAHKQDEEWNTFANDNASGNGELMATLLADSAGRGDASQSRRGHEFKAQDRVLSDAR